MTKLLSLVKTQAGVSPEAFREYWRGPFLQSLLELKGVKNTVDKVTHNHSFPLVIRDDFPVSPWAGFSEIWFDREQDGVDLINHPRLSELLAAHSEVVAEIVHVHCNALPVWDNGSSGPIKMTGFFHHSATMTRAQSQEYWTQKHVPFGRELQKPERFCPKYVQNHALPAHHHLNPNYDFTGAAELWFFSREAALEMFSETTGLEALQADEAKFSNAAATVALMTDDQPVYSREGGFI